MGISSVFLLDHTNTVTIITIIIIIVVVYTINPSRFSILLPCFYYKLYKSIQKSTKIDYEQLIGMLNWEVLLKWDET